MKKFPTHNKKLKDWVNKMAKMCQPDDIVWIDGSQVVVIGGVRKVQFAGFPTGSGPPSFQGKWTMDDLKAALDQATAGK